MKTQERESVVHDWLLDLPFTQQAVLFTAIRGCDGLPKNHPTKKIVHFVRGCVLKAAYGNYNPNDDYHPNGFMRGDYHNFDRDAEELFNDIDATPIHFFMHLVHAAQIIGYNHPDRNIADYWEKFYFYACNGLHMAPESKQRLNNRLSK